MRKNFWIAGAIALAVIFATSARPVLATNANGNNGNIAGAAGVVIDANGVLKKNFVADQTGQLTKNAMAAARANLNANVAKNSTLRKISLNRLEAALKEILDSGKQPTAEMRNLAGLTRVQYVFYYPDTKDIVVAGPAEGWAADLAGRVRGIESGRPTIPLEDLIVALRAFAPKGKDANVVGCSIDPTKEGLANMQQTLTRLGSRATPNDTAMIVDALKQAMGLQNVTINGVSDKTHFAQVLVEADYRMKLIGIGLEPPPAKMTTYIQAVSSTGGSRNALQRWYFVPEYECVRVSDDKNAMELVGEGVKLVAADEAVLPNGVRQGNGNVDKASRTFVDSFTKSYPKLAVASPVYAQLRNCIDLVVAAAFIKKQEYYQKSGWTANVLLDEQKVPVETLAAPKHVETAVNSVWKGQTLMTPVGGGVHIEGKEALTSSNLLEDKDEKVKKAHKSIKLDSLANGQWWWD